MKRFFWVVLMFAAIAVGPLFSIDDNWYTKHSAAIKDGGLMINAGFAAGWWGIGAAAALDYVLPNTPFTLGGGAGFVYWDYLPGKSFNDINYSRVFIPLSFRFAWHPDLGVPNLDLYALAAVTPAIFIETWPEYSYSAAKYEAKTRSGLWWASIIGVSVGARYFLVPNIGAFLELGYGISPVTVGVTFKL